MVIMFLLLMLLTGCITTKETVRLVYIYPVVMAPSVDEIPELPEYKFDTVASLPENVILPVDHAVDLGKWIIKIQETAESLKLKLQYYIDNTDWNKNESE